MKCRHCGSLLHLNFLDLGSAPPSNAYLTAAALQGPEVWFPLRLLVCESCWLVQTEDHAGREQLFDADYAYFSSFSSSWLAHAQQYVGAMRERFALGPASCVVEVAANDGYLLQYVQEAGVPCYGIEPTASTAAAARGRGIDIVESFFGVALARELAAAGRQADLMAANNVLAHVPDINDFVAGFATLLKPQGVLFHDGTDRHFHAVVTNQRIEGGRLLDWHREKAGTVEHTHDEVKNELGGGHVPSQRFGVNSVWFKISLLTYNLVSAIKGLCLEGEERTARMKRFRLLLIHVAGRMNRNNCVMGLRLCHDAAALKRMQRVWQVFELPTQATSAKALGRRGG